MGDPDCDFFFPDEFPYDCTDSPHLEVDDSDEDDSKMVDVGGCSPQSTLCSDRDWESSSEQHNRQLQVSQLLKQQQQQQRQRWRRNNGRQAMVAEYGMRAMLMSSAHKWRRESSTGTGVFLPRATTPLAPPSEITPTTRKKPACSTVLVPARVVQALNLNLEEMGARPAFPGGGFILDKEAMKARTRRTLQSSQQKTNPNRLLPSSSSDPRQISLPPARDDSAF